MNHHEEKRKAWEHRTRAKLDDLEAEFERLRARGHGAAGGAKALHEEWMDTLSAQRDRAAEKWEELKASGGETWEQLREGSESVWDDFTAALSGARDAIRKH